jgi:serine/threonine-protein kinase BUR1
MSLLTIGRWGPLAISMLSELLRLDWRKRLNAIDALKHPYFRTDPLPARPGEIPTFEDSHELDRRKFRSQKAAPPPAPKGGTVGIGSWGNDGSNGGQRGYNGDNYGGMNRHQYHPNQHLNPPYTGYRNGGPPPAAERRPAWSRDGRVDSRGPPRPPVDYQGGSWSQADGGRSRDDNYNRDRPPRSRGGANGAPTRGDVDTYIPSYGADGERRNDRPRDDRRRWDDGHRERLDYDDRGRNPRTHSRSRSPMRERERDRIRDRDSLDMDVYRR